MRATGVCLPKHFLCELPHLAGSRYVTATFVAADEARFGPRSALPGTEMVHAISKSLWRVVVLPGVSVVGSSPVCDRASGAPVALGLLLPASSAAEHSKAKIASAYAS